MTLLFQEGDRVYCPMLGTQVFELVSTEVNKYPVAIVLDWQTFKFTIDGRTEFKTDAQAASLFMATYENKTLLSQLHTLDFADPAIQVSKTVTMPQPYFGAIDAGTKVYVVNLAMPNAFTEIRWTNTDNSRHLQSTGLVHLSKENAIACAEALKTALGGV